MKNYELILFDFDGTLFDSWPGIYDAYLETYLYFYPGKDYSHIAKIRNRHNDYIETFKEVFQVLEIDKEIDAYLHKVYLEKVVQSSNLFPGVQKVIAFIEKQSSKWGIVTSKKRAFTEKMLLSSMLTSHVCLICEEDVVNKKPDPEPLLIACEKLRVDPKRAIYVGDTLSDIVAAQAAGMDSVLALYGYLAEPELARNCGATYYISSIQELLPIISDAAKS